MVGLICKLKMVGSSNYYCCNNNWRSQLYFALGFYEKEKSKKDWFDAKTKEAAKSSANGNSKKTKER